MTVALGPLSPGEILDRDAEGNEQAAQARFPLQEYGGFYPWARQSRQVVRARRDFGAQALVVTSGGAMKNIVLALLLVLPTLALAENPDRSKYVIPVHVLRSWITWDCPGGSQLHLQVVVGRKKYELQETHARRELLKPGDYMARTLKPGTNTAYDDVQEYEFLFPDGQTRRYSLAGEEE